MIRLQRHTRVIYGDYTETFYTHGTRFKIEHHRWEHPRVQHAWRMYDTVTTAFTYHNTLADVREAIEVKPCFSN